MTCSYQFEKMGFNDRLLRGTPYNLGEETENQEEKEPDERNARK
jgi:hypothetical protein